MFKKVAVALAAAFALVGSGVAATPAVATPPPSVSGAATSVNLATDSVQKLAPPTNTKPSDFKAMPAGKGKLNLKKGNPALRPEPKATNAKVAGPTALSRTSCTTPGGCYFYAGGRKTATNTGCSANITIDWSYADVESSDLGAHSLTECDVESGSGATRQIVEVGVTRDDGQFNPGNDGDDEPHLFVYHWVNGVPQGYGTNFLRFTGTGASPYGPGDSLVSLAGTRKQINMEYINQSGTTKGWWVAFDQKWVGVFPADPAGTSTATNRWYPGTFTSGSGAQFFWEVWSNFNEPCTDMGNGRWGSSTFAPPYDYNYDPSLISAAAMTGVTGLTLTTFTPATVNYDMQAVSGVSMLGGGGGYTSTGADWGAINGC